MLSVIKSKQDNDLTDRIGMVYTENETEMSLSIELGAVGDENQTGQWPAWSYRCDLRWKLY